MTTIFNEDKNETPENKSTSQVDDTNVNNQFNDLLNTIKNDSGERKYNTVESALEALKHSQEYIPNLQTDKDKLSQELETLKGQQSKIEDLTSIVEKLTAQKVEPSDQTNNTLGEQDVAKLVQAALSQNQAEATKTSNTKSVTDEMSKLFGTEAEKSFYGKADELGMTKESFNELAATSPKAVLALFGKSAQTPSLTTGSQNVNRDFTKPVNSGAVDKSEKSIMAGASTRDLVAEMKRHREAVYAKHNVQH
tara:strand:- start:463 stop:1215 length:753 start_codon:yes stop_codon:yes gene_type:complete